LGEDLQAKKGKEQEQTAGAVNMTVRSYQKRRYADISTANPYGHLFYLSN